MRPNRAGEGGTVASIARRLSRLEASALATRRPVAPTWPLDLLSDDERLTLDAIAARVEHVADLKERLALMTDAEVDFLAGIAERHRNAAAGA